MVTNQLPEEGDDRWHVGPHVLDKPGLKGQLIRGPLTGEHMAPRPQKA